jgi:hypothetical protein
MPSIDFPAILTDSSRSLMEYTASAIGHDPVRFKEVMALAWAQEYPLCMRAARVADLCCERDPGLIRPYLPEMVRRLPEINDMSVRRIFLHILVRHSWIDDEEAMGRMVDCLFKWILDKNQAISVRAYSIYVLENVAKVEPELKGELAAVMQETLVLWDSPGLRSIARKLLKRLK